MKIAFFGDYQLGVIKGDHIVDVSDALHVHAHHPQELITALIENFDQVRAPLERAVAKSSGVPLATVKLLPPVPQPEKLICMAVNYLEAENAPVPEIDAFLKASDTVIGDGDTVLLDPACKATIFHAEAELAIVIGKESRSVKEADGLDAVFGYTCFFDVSARGFNPRGAQSYFQAKSWPTFGPMGPFLVTKDEIKDPHNLNVRVRNNDFAFPGYNTRDMAHKIPAVVAFASRIMTLHAGDVISTGTHHQNLGAIQEGDMLTMEIDGIGALHVTVHDPTNREWPRGRDEATASRMRRSASSELTFDPGKPQR